MEIWNDVVGYEGLYQVSNNGKIISCNRMVNFRNGQKMIKGKELKLQEDAYGYLVVSLYKNGHRKNKKVHRLVADAFLENPKQLPVINHKNENKKDNRLANLEFCTIKENTHYSLSKKVVGKHRETNKVILFNSTREADAYGFNSCNISLCCNGKLRSHKGYEWKYVEEG